MFSQSLITQLNNQLKNILGSLQYLAPELFLAGLFVLLIVLDLVFSTRKPLQKPKSKVLWWVSLGGLAAVILLLFAQLQFVYKIPDRAPIILGTSSPALKPHKLQQLFLGLISLNKLSVIFRLIISFVGILTLLISRNSRLLKPVSSSKVFQYQGEYFAIIVAMLLGLHLLTLTNHLLMIYVAIELVSISSYILTILHFNKKGIEGALKYLLFGAFASGLMIYGMSWLYGLSGNLSLSSFTAQITGDASMLNTLASLLVLAGILFKVSAVPFHFWTPDAYQAAPTPVVAFFSIAPKVALLVVLAKVVSTGILLVGIDTPYFQQMLLLLGIIAILTVFVGNFTALWQQNVKRLLAYSAIAHIGILLMALLDVRGISAHLSFYLIVYALMIFGAFLGIEMVARNFKDHENPYALEHYHGLGTKHPLVGVCLLVLMIALTGLPPTAGFQAKLFIFTGLWESYQSLTSNIHLYALIAGIFTTAVALFYYLRIPFLMFIKSTKNDHKSSFSLSDQILLLGFTLAVVLLFFKADWLFDLLV